MLSVLLHIKLMAILEMLNIAKALTIERALILKCFVILGKISSTNRANAGAYSREPNSTKDSKASKLAAKYSGIGSSNAMCVSV